MNKIFKVGLIGCGHISETYFRAEKYFNNIKIIKCADINFNNAKKFIDDFGNPYSRILIDKDGILGVEFGAYGVPETFLVDKNKDIIKKFVGPINQEIVNEIKLIIK